MSKPTDVRPHERKLVTAALRYVAVADWFESRLIPEDSAGEAEALDTFNRAEANLRRVALPILRKHGMRASILFAAGAGNVEPPKAEPAAAVASEVGA